MKSFNIHSHLNKIYAGYPEGTHRPVIGITGNFADGNACLCDRYYRQIEAAGGTPVIIPPVADKDIIVSTLDSIDGLMLSGGSDFNPLWAGEEPVPGLHGINAERDLAELLTIRLAFNRQMPMLGICRGMQALAMALDGKVTQDIESIRGRDGKALPAIKHSQQTENRGEPTHSVRIEKNSVLYSLFNREKIYVNSFHHQAVGVCGRHFNVSATAPDGTTEAMESSEHKPVMGVQWHPEWLGDEGLPLFKWLVDNAATFGEAKRLHDRIVTLDTHCDTPMFFPQGARFDRRDNDILVDLHKMTDGRLDAVTMAAYLPQPAEGQTFANVSPYAVESPAAYASEIFDKIEETVRDNALYLGMARTPGDIAANKAAGRKSVLLGIENGIALEHDIANVELFARRGVTYMTLCHNGDNDICDSARRSAATHNGVSSFGAGVIREMNLCGMMVDMSHAGEKSFYDALDISSMPIVCSHSNCRALCDVPRNLTDDQMRALALKGGVMHITLYHGFLRNDDGEANILDAMAHLEHAIDIMGIDHVGLGTDFDGDGGICGLADASELINFTMQLLRRRYSHDDIERIWGGNWMRVMRAVQEYSYLSDIS